MNRDLIATLLADVVPTVIFAPTLPSTNATARKHASDKLPLLVTCDMQTAGRGRHGRTWVSATGQSLTFTLALRPCTLATTLSMVVAVGVANCLTRHGHDIGLKWPNDLQAADGTKLGGILIEAVATTQIALIGVGINLMQFNELAQADFAAGSLYTHPAEYERERLLADLVLSILQTVALCEQSGWANQRAAWLRRCVHRPGSILNVTLPTGKKMLLSYLGINDAGELLGMHADGTRHTVTCAEVEDVTCS